LKQAPDLGWWDGGELQSGEDNKFNTGWVSGVWNASEKTATLRFSARGENYDPEKPFDPSGITRILFKGGGPANNDPIWTIDDIEKVALVTVDKTIFCDICFYTPCKCDDLCWRCGEELYGCICMCESCGQKVCPTTPPVLPSYYTVPEGAVWLGCYEADSEIQFRWVIDSDLKARIQSGELNKLILYIDADKVGTNTTPAGRVGTVVMAINASRTGVDTWHQQSPAFNYAGKQLTPAEIKETGHLIYYLDHNPNYDLINWNAEAMFQIYVQCTASQGRIEGLHFIAGYLGKALPDDPKACEDCERLICICDKPRPYEIGGSVDSRWTWSNTATQLGHQFGTAFGDPSFTSFKNSKYMAFEVKSNNATHVPGLRIIFLGAGQSSHSNNTIYSRITPFANTVDSTYYIVIELEKILETNSLADDSGTGGQTAWEKIKAGSSARFYLQDGWQTRVQNVWLLDEIAGPDAADKTVLIPGKGFTWTSSGGGTEVADLLSRDLPGFVTANKESIFGEQE